MKFLFSKHRFLNFSTQASSSAYKMKSGTIATYNRTSTHECTNLRSLWINIVLNRFVRLCPNLMVNAYRVCWLITHPVCSSRPLSSATSCSTTKFSLAAQATESPLYQYYRGFYSPLFTWQIVYVYFTCLRHLRRAPRIEDLQVFISTALY